MSDFKSKVIQAEKFYTDSLLNFDLQLAQFTFESLKPFFKGKIALELGPSTGYMTKQLVNEFELLHVVEGSSTLLNQIPDYNNIVKYNAFFEEFKADTKYDTIIMSHVLEHIQDPVTVLKKIRMWMKEDAVFLVSVPNANSIHRMAAVEMGLLKSVSELNARDHELGHYRVYDLQLLKTHLQEAGFQIKQSGGVFLKPLSNGQIEQNWTKEMIHGFFALGKKFPELCAEIFVVAELV